MDLIKKVNRVGGRQWIEKVEPKKFDKNLIYIYTWKVFYDILIHYFFKNENRKCIYDLIGWFDLMNHGIFHCKSSFLNSEFF